MIEVIAKDVELEHTLVGVSDRIIYLRNAWAEYEKGFESNKRAYEQYINSLENEKSMLLENVNVERLHNALALLQASGLEEITGSTEGELNLFWERLEPEVLKLRFPFVPEEPLSQRSMLRSEYIGVKDYARWVNQCFICSYGYSPTHGYVVASIGLLPEMRRETFTEEQVRDILYLLYVVKTGKFKLIEG